MGQHGRKQVILRKIGQICRPRDAIGKGGLDVDANGRVDHDGTPGGFDDG